MIRRFRDTKFILRMIHSIDNQPFCLRVPWLDQAFERRRMPTIAQSLADDRKCRTDVIKAASKLGPTSSSGCLLNCRVARRPAAAVQLEARATYRPGQILQSCKKGSDHETAIIPSSKSENKVCWIAYALVQASAL
jgi:hypothetical protein